VGRPRGNGHHKEVIKLNGVPPRLPLFIPPFSSLLHSSILNCFPPFKHPFALPSFTPLHLHFPYITSALFPPSTYLFHHTIQLHHLPTLSTRPYILLPQPITYSTIFLLPPPLLHLEFRKAFLYYILPLNVTSMFILAEKQKLNGPRSRKWRHHGYNQRNGCHNPAD